jgi:outer membrane protein OmpA-like peptidoglycan-associated protein
MSFSRKVSSVRGLTLAVAAMCGLSFASCAHPGRKTAIGAGAGGAVGAAVGGATGGWKGAAIGAVVGGAVGGAAGNYLDKQAQELAQVADTRRTRDGVLVQLKSDLLFNTDSAELKPDARQQLSELGDILAKYRKDRIKILGYTDSTGSESHNETLSRERAQSVSDVLLSRNVLQAQLEPQGLGENAPVASNDTRSGRARNRRVELMIDAPNPGNSSG